jgi:hypothetical protein
MNHDDINDDIINDTYQDYYYNYSCVSPPVVDDETKRNETKQIWYDCNWLNGWMNEWMEDWNVIISFHGILSYGRYL